MDSKVKAAEHCCEVNHSEHEVFAEKTKKWDRLGIYLSAFCALHCVLTPFLIIGLPYLGSFFENEFIHIGLALMVIPVGAYAFLSGYKHHQQKSVVVVGLIGMALLVSSFLSHHHDHADVHVGHFDYLTLGGGLLLVLAHVLNRRACLCHKHT